VECLSLSISPPHFLFLLPITHPLSTICFCSISFTSFSSRGEREFPLERASGNSGFACGLSRMSDSMRFGRDWVYSLRFNIQFTSLSARVRLRESFPRVQAADSRFSVFLLIISAVWSKSYCSASFVIQTKRMFENEKKKNLLVPNIP